MNIRFTLLQPQHFQLLLKWLEMPHVKAWWDQDIVWDLKLIEEKFGSYVNGYKIEAGIKKQLQAYIISVGNCDIGYIQYYNAYDFQRSAALQGLPTSMAALDIFIGEPEYLGQGVGASCLQKFLCETIDQEYEYCFVDPDINNIAAIKTYTKAGFVPHMLKPELGAVSAVPAGKLWMLRAREAVGAGNL